MNIADHALRAIKEPAVGISEGSRSNPKKGAKELIDSNADAIVRWIAEGLPASTIAPKLGVSSTSFWHHINDAISVKAVLDMRFNAQKNRGKKGVN